MKTDDFILTMLMKHKDLLKAAEADLINKGIIQPKDGKER